jgi:transcription elongation factor Elf1
MGENPACVLCGDQLHHVMTTLVRGRQRTTWHCTGCGAEVTAEAMIEP